MTLGRRPTARTRGLYMILFGIIFAFAYGTALATRAGQGCLQRDRITVFEIVVDLIGLLLIAAGILITIRDRRTLRP